MSQTKRMRQLIVGSYARLIRAKRKALEDVPDDVLDELRKTAPDLFGDDA